MKLVHFSTKPLTSPIKFKNCRRFNHNGKHSTEVRQEAALKPQGLWISDETQRESWLWWSHENDFRTGDLNVATEVMLDDSKILYIRNGKELDRFAQRYAVAICPGDKDKSSYHLWSRNIAYNIDWPEVAKNYSGIVITPYQWDKRFTGGLWYYGWDCASGCIWNDNAFLSARQMLPNELVSIRKNFQEEAA